MKIALVADQLLGVFGSERVFQYVCETFPEADIYTWVYNRATTFKYFESRHVRTGPLSVFLNRRNWYLWTMPFAAFCMSKLKLENYDLVISCSATVAKYVSPRRARHICYCYVPTRALWFADEYFGSGVKRKLLEPLLQAWRYFDARTVSTVDRMLTISGASQQYIKKCYGVDADILRCPIDTDRFYPSTDKGDHYLIVSRLEKWKRVDYAVEAFRNLDRKLRILGTGPEEKALRRMAGPNVTFLGSVSDEELAREYSAARALIFVPEIEGGMTPVEANACGTPTICYASAGARELQRPVKESGQAGTSVFYFEQTPEALVRAVRQFEELTFDQQAMRQHAIQWSVPVFKSQLRSIVEDSVEVRG